MGSSACTSLVELGELGRLSASIKKLEKEIGNKDKHQVKLCLQSILYSLKKKLCMLDFLTFCFLGRMSNTARNYRDQTRGHWLWSKPEWISLLLSVCFNWLRRKSLPVSLALSVSPPLSSLVIRYYYSWQPFSLLLYDVLVVVLD